MTDVPRSGISGVSVLQHAWKKKIPRLLQLILHPVCYSEKAEQILWVYRQKISYQCHRLSAQMSVIPLPTIPSNMCTILTIQSNGSLPKICWVFPHWFSIVHESFFFFLLALQPPLGVVFYSPLVGFSLLACEVSWSHTTTRHIR